jgi:hypothetical protein
MATNSDGLLGFLYEKITKRKKQIRRELNLYPHYMSTIDRLDRMGAGRDTFP